ncbi:hypothetical protein AMJ85_05815 [candidate division BRC1 bacterium SM23_51]|nr:MAG: hypothetical protein AMJ85_05815 [candidate division BRC1 bacterium SM23_51]
MTAGPVCLDRVRVVGRRRIELDRGAWRWLVFSGLALGLGLMTKIALGLMAPIVAGALALYAWVRGRHSFKRIVVEQFVIVGVAVLVNLPWHLAMTLSPKAHQFWGYYIGYHLLGRTATTLDEHTGPWYFYFGELWNYLPAPVLAMALVALPWFVAAIIGSFRKNDGSHAETGAGGNCKDHERPWHHRDLRYLLPLLWFGFQLALFSVASTKRDTYTIPMYPPIALMAALFLGERLRDRQRLKLLATTLFVLTTLCILSRMKTFGDQLDDAFANLDVIALYGDVFAQLGLLIAGVAAATAAIYLLLLRRAALFRSLALTTIVVATTVFSLREVRRVFDPEKGTRKFGWQEIRPFVDSMDYHYLVFAGSYLHPAVRYYLNGLLLNWHPYIVFAPLPVFDQTRLAQYASGDSVRVIVMRSWIELNWTPQQRAQLLDRLEPLADTGDDLAIYRLKGR